MEAFRKKIADERGREKKEKREIQRGREKEGVRERKKRCI